MMVRIGTLLFLLLFNQVQASDLAKEKRWADQVVDSILDGDAVWLKADSHEFLSILTEAEEESNRALIVIHGTGVHPNWDQVIQPIRVEMTTRGWNTLSIQMPILANEAEHDDYAPLFPGVIPRIDAAVAYLQAQGNQKIVLVAHSLGSLMTSFYLSEKHPDLVKGFVAIGMSGGAKHAVMDSLQTLKSVNLPVLDLFGSDDLPEVLAHKKTKPQAALSKYFDQVEVEGANHFFDDHNDELINAISNWVDKLP